VKIVVNHLTRMKPGYICVAGIDLQSSSHVRPVLAGAQRLTTKLLLANGGPFDMNVVVDLGKTEAKGAAPETEDHLFDPGLAKPIKELDTDAFWKLLRSVSKKTLSEIFGAELTVRGNGRTVDQGTGGASLGCLAPATPPAFYVNPWDKIRVSVTDGALSADLSVTDLRLYENDGKTPRAKSVHDLQDRIKAGINVVLSVGLTRPFQASGDSAARHWLQLNNVHLEDDPGWQLTCSP
jgi:hypothetical protein